MSASVYVVPALQPPDEMVRALVERVVTALAGALPLDPAALRRTVEPVLTEAVADHARALQERLVAAETAARTGQLAAGVAHELRNPLSVIETSAYILAERFAEDARAQRHLRRITDQVGLAVGIVTDLLDTARERPVERVPTDVAGVVRDAVAQVPRAPEIALDLALPAALPSVPADAGRLRQVFVNLVTNAYQALGGAGGRVEVGATAADDHVTVTVRDHGPGIPEEVLARLFEPLFSARRGGVGLGLALARRIVEAHGGTLTAANAPGGGARFTVTLARPR